MLLRHCLPLLFLHIWLNSCPPLFQKAPCRDDLLCKESCPPDRRLWKAERGPPNNSSFIFFCSLLTWARCYARASHSHWLDGTKIQDLGEIWREEEEEMGELGGQELPKQQSNKETLSFSPFREPSITIASACSWGAWMLVAFLFTSLPSQERQLQGTISQLYSYMQG